MFGLVKLLTWLVSPLVIALLLGLIAWWQAYQGKRRRAVIWLVLTAVWILVWSSPLFFGWFGSTLEREYPPCRAEDVSAGDAIVVLGGGMGAPHGAVIYPDMSGGADRVWQAARLYRAGKAPWVVVSGSEEGQSSVVLLRDLGVPAEALLVEDESRTTAENARFTSALLARMGVGRRVLLVTSAFHMRRARLLFERAGLIVIPAATDYEAMLLQLRPDRWSLTNLLPDPEMLHRNTYILKEYVGYWVRRVTR